MNFEDKITNEFRGNNPHVSLYQIVSQETGLLTTKQVNTISNAIQSSQSLESINLSDCTNIENTNINTIIEALHGSNKLTELYLNNLKINKEAAESLVVLINNCPLKKLSIANIKCAVTDFITVIKSLETNKTIESLIMGSITINTMKALSKALLDNITITSLLYDLSLTSYNTPDNYVNIASNIADALDRNTKIKEEKDIERILKQYTLEQSAKEEQERLEYEIL